MYVDGSAILAAAALFSAIGILATGLYKIFKWVDRQKEQDAEIESIKKEQCVICYGLLATLDGLKQLGANGNVTDAHNKLEKHINQTAHDISGFGCGHEYPSKAL